MPSIAPQYSLRPRRFTGRFSGRLASRPVRRTSSYPVNSTLATPPSFLVLVTLCFFLFPALLSHFHRFPFLLSLLKHRCSPRLAPSPDRFSEGEFPPGHPSPYRRFNCFPKSLSLAQVCTLNTILTVLQMPVCVFVFSANHFLPACMPSLENLDWIALDPSKPILCPPGSQLASLSLESVLETWRFRDLY